MSRKIAVVFWILAVGVCGVLAAGEGVTVRVDASRIVAPYRDLMGVNRSPLLRTRNGKRIDLSYAYRLLKISEVRLHDDAVDVCKIYTNDRAVEVQTGRDVSRICKFTGRRVDVPHVVWRVRDAQAIDRPEHYDFTRADRAIRSVVDIGAKVYLRLGESWMGPNDTDTPDAFARVAANIYRHYTGTFKPGNVHPDISAVEIYNEPDGRFWVGGNKRFYRLSLKTLEAIRHTNPSIDIGGAGFVHGINAHLVDSQSVAHRYIAAIGAGQLDFFSAHYYGECRDEVWANFTDWADTLRSQLDARGMSDKPIHLSEWNIGAGMRCARERPNAFRQPYLFSYTAGMLMLMQHVPLNIAHAHYYAGHGSEMALFSPDQTGRRLRVSKAALAFALHRQLIGSRAVATQICQSGRCMDPYAYAKANHLFVAQAYREDKRVKILLVNDSNKPRRIAIKCAQPHGAVRLQWYRPPRQEVSVDLVPSGDAWVPQADQLDTLFKQSIEERHLRLKASQRSFVVLLKPYSAAVAMLEP